MSVNETFEDGAAAVQFGAGVEHVEDGAGNLISHGHSVRVPRTSDNHILSGEVMAKQIALILGLLFLAGPGIFRLAHALDVPATFILAIVFGAMAGWAGRHTDDSQAWAAAFETALNKCGLNHKAAAHAMGISETQLSAQLVGREMLSAYRIAQLGPTFKVAFAAELAAQEGSALIEPGVLLSILSELRSLIGRREVA